MVPHGVPQPQFCEQLLKPTHLALAQLGVPIYYLGLKRTGLPVRPALLRKEAEIAMTDDVKANLEESNSFGEANGIEVEAPTLFDEVPIGEPFNPDDIDVATRSMTIDLLLSRIRSDAIDLEPDFQRRRGIWTERQQSRLIESLLLRISEIVPRCKRASLSWNSW